MPPPPLSPQRNRAVAIFVQAGIIRFDGLLHFVRLKIQTKTRNIEFCAKNPRNSLRHLLPVHPHHKRSIICFSGTRPLVPKADGFPTVTTTRRSNMTTTLAYLDICLGSSDYFIFNRFLFRLSENNTLIKLIVTMENMESQNQNKLLKRASLSWIFNSFCLRSLCYNRRIRFLPCPSRLLSVTSSIPCQIIFYFASQ